MQIQEMLKNDINRNITGVAQVSQTDMELLKQEQEEYVLTRELKHHFVRFFSRYSESFDQISQDIGVWISGVWGCGKSHLLKILSQLLENKEIDGVSSLERLRNNIEDSRIVTLIEKAVGHEAETILFNMWDSDKQGRKSVIQKFAERFYNYTGFYGNDLSAIESGKLEISIDKLVLDINEYVSKKPRSYRLLFMVDDIGRYEDSDLNYLRELQALTEEIADKCLGKVWIICTVQKDLDEVIESREEEFSKIQLRFPLRLKLTLASAEEVIQRRLLDKTPEASLRLSKIYSLKEPAIKSLVRFRREDIISEIRGFNRDVDFLRDFPFVPYQVVLVQKIFSDVMKNNKLENNGKLSLLSGFLEVVKKVRKKDEYYIVPFYLFYDLIQDYLDNSVKKMIERCEREVERNLEIKPIDVKVLKLLYLLKHIDSIKSTADSIAILMTNDLNMNKIRIRDEVQASLNRLLKGNRIGKAGNIYYFLTEEEHDIANDIRDTPIDLRKISEEINEVIFGEIFPNKKFSYSSQNRVQDFPLDSYVDNIGPNLFAEKMQLCIYSIVTDESKKEDLQLLEDSQNRAIVLLGDEKYYEHYINALKIRKYMESRDVSQLPKSTQNIISRYKEEEERYKEAAHIELIKAVEDGTFYIDGEKVDIPSGGTAKDKLNQVLERLFRKLYPKFDLIVESSNTDQDILDILNKENISIEGLNPNEYALVEIKEFLNSRAENNQETTISDIQNKFQGIPYGWSEFDIAALIANLLCDQQITIKYEGKIVLNNDQNLPTILRDTSGIWKFIISKQENLSKETQEKLEERSEEISEEKPEDKLEKKEEERSEDTSEDKLDLRKIILSKQRSLDPIKLNMAIDLLRNYFQGRDIPKDEKGLVEFIVEEFSKLKGSYEQLNERYSGITYPDQVTVEKSIQFLGDILSQSKNPISLIDSLVSREKDLLATKEGLGRIEMFFKDQVSVFNDTIEYINLLKEDIDYINKDQRGNSALSEIQKIIGMAPNERFDYARISELRNLKTIVSNVYKELFDQKRQEMLEITIECQKLILEKIEQFNNDKNLANDVDTYFAEKREELSNYEKIVQLDEFRSQIIGETREILIELDSAIIEQVPEEPKKEYYKIESSKIFPNKTLSSEADIEEYIRDVYKNMSQYLKEYGGFTIN